MMNTAMLASLLVLLVTFPIVFATDYTVGDASGWNQGVDYTTWTSGKTFKVGDNLVFKYGSLHQVDEVSENDYKSCSSANSIKTYQDGDSKVALTKAGKIYFICPTPGHCGSGMKLEINVVAASTPPSTGTPPTTPSGSTPPTTPSGTPSTTPSTPSNSPATSSPPPTKPSGAVSTVSSGIISLLMGSFLVLAFMG